MIIVIAVITVILIMITIIIECTFRQSLDEMPQTHSVVQYSLSLPLTRNSFPSNNQQLGAARELRRRQRQ